jgi:glycosyltransferase involved in cell wall biosynthesis
MKKSISIVIPAYNEERYLGDCLEAIARQTVAPDEVIVVDNNSTDRTAEIARSFPFVTIVSESAQGRGHAYSAGMNAAKGDIVGRINGDSKIHPDWVQRVRQNFQSDPRLGGLTGPAITDTIPGTHFWMTTTWARGYFRWNEAVQRVNTLWGANMAISRQAWLAVRQEVCKDDSLVHDDQDLAYLLNGKGLPIRRDNQLLITAYGQHYHMWPKLREYMHRRQTTKRLHEQKGTLRQPGALALPYRVTVINRLFGTPPLLLFLGASFLRYHLFARWSPNFDAE